MTAEPFDLDALLKRHPLPWQVDRPDGKVTRDANREVVHGHDAARLLAAAPGMMRAIINICPPGPRGIYATVPLTTALRESLP